MIIVAIISALASITASILSVINVRVSNRQQEISITQDLASQLSKHQAISDLKIDTLTQEVQKHNNFAQRIPVLEERVKNLEGDIKELKVMGS